MVLNLMSRQSNHVFLKNLFRETFNRFTTYRKYLLNKRSLYLSIKVKPSVTLKLKLKTNYFSLFIEFKMILSRLQNEFKNLNPLVLIFFEGFPIYVFIRRGTMRLRLRETCFFVHTLAHRRQAQCSTFVFVAPAVQQSELKMIKSTTSEPIFQNMFIDSSRQCT